MKKIDTLVSDIYGLFEKPLQITKDEANEFGRQLGEMLVRRLSEERGKPYLRLSNAGTPCRRKLWYSLNTPKLAEPLSAPTRIKFLFGDILELLLLFLARLSGHTVEREQEKVTIDGVEGSIDATVDGELIDCKSASTFSFNKFKDHGLAENDGFGYLGQLSSYRRGVGGERAHFLAIDKTLGNITLDTWIKDELPEIDFEAVRKDVQSPIPPPRGYEDVPEGGSGNRKLGVSCSYCGFKRHCWPGLKEYNYARGPVYLTHVEREPRVPVAK